MLATSKSFRPLAAAGDRHVDDRPAHDPQMPRLASSLSPASVATALPSAAMPDLHRSRLHFARPAGREVDRKGHNPAEYTHLPSYRPGAYTSGPGYYIPNNWPEIAHVPPWAEPPLST